MVTSELDLQIKYINLTSSASITNYINKKLSKKNIDYKDIISLNCCVTMESLRGGKTYSFVLTVDLKQAGFVVRAKGADLYKLIDEISDKFFYRLNKFIDKHNNQSQISHYTDTATPTSIVSEETKEYSAPYPSESGLRHSIIEKRHYMDNSPLHIEEAIQILELTGKECVLFKNINNGKYAVIYRVSGKKRIGYGLLEPKG